MKYLEVMMPSGSNKVTVVHYAGQEEMSSDDLRVAARKFDALATALEAREIKATAERVAQDMKRLKELDVEQLVKELEDEVKTALG